MLSRPLVAGPSPTQPSRGSHHYLGPIHRTDPVDIVAAGGSQRLDVWLTVAGDWSRLSEADIVQFQRSAAPCN